MGDSGGSHPIRVATIWNLPRLAQAVTFAGQSSPKTGVPKSLARGTLGRTAPPSNTNSNENNNTNNSNSNICNKTKPNSKSTGSRRWKAQIRGSRGAPATAAMASICGPVYFKPVLLAMMLAVSCNGDYLVSMPYTYMS